MKMATYWMESVGAFVLPAPLPVKQRLSDKVWAGHTRYTRSSQWTSDELMPNPVIRAAYAESNVKTLLGRTRKLGSAASPLEGMHLYHLARQHGVRRSLEVGMACGMSTLYLLQGILDAHRDRSVAEASAASGEKRERDAADLEPEAKRGRADGAAGDAGASASAASAMTAAEPATTQRPADEPATAWRPAAEHIISEDRFAAVAAPPTDVLTRAKAAADEGCLHISLDPFQETQWEGAARAQVRRAGLDPLSAHVQAMSHIAMPAIEAELGPESLDLVFVDGMHLYDFTLVDLFCADRLVRVGGIIALDDIKHAGVKACEAYIESNYPHWRRVWGTACDRTAGTWIKEGPDVRKWDDHVAIPAVAQRKRP